jgi:predicted MPP superfamily phosphohydrolase
VTRRSFHIPWRIYARLSLYFAACWTIVGLLLNGVVPFALWITAALALYTTVPLAVFLTAGGWSSYPRAAFRLWVMRPFWYTQLLLPLVAASGAAGLLIGAPFGRALFAARVIAGAVAAAMAALFVAGYFGSRRLVVHELDASVPELPPSFDGLTIAHISDLHVGPHTPRRHLQRIRKTLGSLSADVIVINGDLVDDRSEDVEHYAAAFRGLCAPLGVFITTGNHEIYSGWTEVRQRLAQHDLGTLLVNDARALHRGDEVVYVVGVGDPAAFREAPAAAPDLDRAFASVPEAAVTIAFAHNPALWPALLERGTALTLSGHTHWGQFALPRLGWSLASPFLEHAMGVYRQGDGLLYISPGTGYFGIPFRIGAPGEIALVRLRRGPAGIDDRGARAATRINA